MLKKFVINYKTRKTEKHRKNEAHSSFASAKKIGLLFTDQPLIDQENIQKIIDDLNAEGKEISTLAFCKNKKKSSQEFPLFESKDISSFGHINADILKSFITDDLDFLICLDHKKHYLVNYVIAQANAKCRVGVYGPDDFHQFEMIIQGDDQKTATSQEILKYLKMIHHHD